jgi:hypothetical protein
MKIIKRVLLLLFILSTVGILFRGWFYRQLVEYRSVGVRTDYAATEKKLVDYINATADKHTEPDMDQIIKLGLSITSEQINFTMAKNDIDPNKLISSKTAHCVGYATFFATTCNYLLGKYNLSDTWIAKPQIGQLYFLGANIHKLFNSTFFTDHDFVTIENKITGEVVAVDPTINDYLRIDFITYTK